MTETVTRTLTIVNVKGLHARASAKLAELVESFEAGATVSKDGLDATGDSIMGLLMLGASKGTSIDVTCEGADAAALADAIEELVANRFGEDM